jgi:uncharacterized protein (UPF0303 family)
MPEGAARRDMTTDPPTLESLARQEAELVFDRFDEETAWRLGVQLVESAREAGLPVTIDIRRNGHQLFHAALPGTAPDNDAWIERKVRVVTRFGRSSLHVGEAARQAGTTFEEQMRLAPDEYAAHGGGFPVTVSGVGVIGVVTVSGLPQLEDHSFVVEQLRRFLAGSESRLSR